MVRITRVALAADRAVLRIEGWLAEADAGLLEEEVDAVLRASARVVLDLRGVRRIDSAALPRIAAITQRGRAVCLAPGFLREVLEAGGIVVGGEADESGAEPPR